MTARPPSPPVLLSSGHALDGFECGEVSLDDWLKKRALKNQASGTSRCFVVCDGQTVIGYYSLSAGGIHQEAAPKPMRRNMPDPLPVLLLGRLAIDRRHHGQGWGSFLLLDALHRSTRSQVASFAVIVDAIDNDARAFYVHESFLALPDTPRRLFRRMSDIEALFK